jgi:pyridoxamine 5'-phosphate oxidase
MRREWHADPVDQAGRDAQRGAGDPTPHEPSRRLDLSGWRREYGPSAELAETGLRETQMDPDPLVQFARWLADAVATPAVVEPNAMVVATATPAGQPSARLVLLKAVDEAGFVFYTNYTSRKAGELEANPRAALTFPWHAIGRQVRIEGTVARVGRAEAAAYFRSRPRQAQIGTWASRQSTPLADRAVLDDRYAALTARWPEGHEVPVPDFWGGYRVAPLVMEFWAGRPSRLHDRIVYRRTGPDQPWSLVRLAP